MSEPGRARRCVAGGADEMLLPLHAQYALLGSVACHSNSPARTGAPRVLQVEGGPKQVVMDSGSEIQDSDLKHFFKFVCLVNYIGANGSS